MQRFIFFILFFVILSKGFTQITDPKLTEIWEPEPRIVTPGVGTAPPSDAIVLFDGTNLDEWTSMDDLPAKWKVENGIMTVVPGTGWIKTKRSFGSIQLHVEFRSPKEVKGEGSRRGNSGIFLQTHYEIQILDSYENRVYANGQAGSIYKQHIPLVNASRPPGEWQTFDILYTAPTFNKDGILTSPARVTILHNGVLIQNNVEIKGKTTFRGLPRYQAHGNLPIALQNHGGDLVSFRNIWVREL